MNSQYSYSFLFRSAALCGVALLSFLNCSSTSSDLANNNDNSGNNGGGSTSGDPVQVWLTKGDQSVKLQQQNTAYFSGNQNSGTTIEVDASKLFQTVDGFGYTLTGGSVQVINQLNAAKKQELLNDLFSSSGIGVSYLRISIGASDLNSEVFSYDDMPAGQTDPTLSQFSLTKDQAVIQMLKDILVINPNIKILATPWSPPVWMKDNGSSIGGSLKPEFYGVYAQYFVKYIQAMQAQGIRIDAITPQNEPLHPGNNPSMYMSAGDQAAFIKNNLGPAFQAANITTKIIAYDHNCDNPAYPLAILSDAAANPYVDGSAFHLYAGDISALGSVHNLFPNKNVYFTEQWTSSTGNFGGDLDWHTKNIIIGSMRNWSRTALEWNVANDASFGPHTPGGCTQCKGAVTITGAAGYEKNVAYYIIAHASKFVTANSQRIESTQADNLSTVAFKTPAGKTVLIVQNGNSTDKAFNIKYNQKTAPVTISGSSTATYIF
ncbi:glycoside hydrolase family 30 protein [Chryseobacterium salviniae]|uniref:Glycoside hydrolase family 30 beta sandwich domain-containing protein n=1 Tax=Chryseobacterium salviniae TaxID=3101750 RepID=A0ABU6HQ42_9FLAO|nr:glycoside hydrolase family 30 beta sandwich domain-containing protein [Chryseobacterium sp. T9W2-O]MEC3875165.1 glycoside hydrolase family 30 beta sandwich domain-containing protein [Chryseobacterium sp. T9W2-O]